MSEDRNWLPPDRAPDIWQLVDGEWMVPTVADRLKAKLDAAWVNGDGDALEVKVWITRKDD